LLRRIEQSRRLGRHAELARPGALDLGQLGELGLDQRQHLGGIAARAADEGRGKAFGIVEQDLENVLGREALMPGTDGQALRRLDEAPRAFGIFFEVHRHLASGPHKAPDPAPTLTAWAPYSLDMCQAAAGSRAGPARSAGGTKRPPAERRPRTYPSLGRSANRPHGDARGGRWPPRLRSRRLPSSPGRRPEALPAADRGRCRLQGGAY